MIIGEDLFLQLFISFYKLEVSFMVLEKMIWLISKKHRELWAKFTLSGLVATSSSFYG
jgi:hypothetical protein